MANFIEWSLAFASGHLLLISPLLILAVCALFAFIGCDAIFGVQSFDPVPPTNLTAQPGFPTVVGGMTPVNLAWSDTPNGSGSGFNIKRGTVQGGPYSLLDQVSVPATTYTDTSTTAGTTFYYEVTTFSDGDETAPSNEASATPEPPFVSSIAVLGGVPGILATDFLGMAIKVGGMNLTVYALGRMMALGNSNIHELRIVDPANPTPPVASVSVNMAGGTVGQFVYGAVSATLNANATYYIVSAEVNGRDAYHTDVTMVATSAVASVTGSIVGNPAGTIFQFNRTVPGATFGPLDFLWTV
jgi:hypothetical protein